MDDTKLNKYHEKMEELFREQRKVELKIRLAELLQDFARNNENHEVPDQVFFEKETLSFSVYFIERPEENTEEEKEEGDEVENS